MEPNVEPLPHTPRSIALALNISEQWARVLCRRILKGRRRRYRLNDEQYRKLQIEYHTYRHFRGPGGEED